MTLARVLDRASEGGGTIARVRKSTLPTAPSTIGGPFPRTHRPEHRVALALMVLTVGLALSVSPEATGRPVAALHTDRPTTRGSTVPRPVLRPLPGGAHGPALAKLPGLPPGTGRPRSRPPVAGSLYMTRTTKFPYEPAYLPIARRLDGSMTDW